jgi:hypothetical protein
MASAGQVVLDALLERGKPSFLQASRVTVHERCVDHVGQCRSAPVRERFPQSLRCCRVLMCGRLLTGAYQQGVDPGDVDGVGLAAQQVAVRPREQQVAAAAVPQPFSEP